MPKPSPHPHAHLLTRWRRLAKAHQLLTSIDTTRTANWHVESQMHPGTSYTIYRRTNLDHTTTYACSCPDKTGQRDGGCKHALAVELATDLHATTPSFRKTLIPLLNHAILTGTKAAQTHNYDALNLAHLLAQTIQLMAKLAPRTPTSPTPTRLPHRVDLL